MVQHFTRMQRRTLLKLGAGAAAVLVVAGGGMAWLQPPGWYGGRLSDGAREVMRAVANVVLDGALPDAASDRARVLRDHLRQLESVIAAFPVPTQSELSQLLALLASAPGRVAFAGLSAPWSVATTADVQRMLRSWMNSRLSLRQQAYHALRDLTNAAYFSSPANWGHMGYPGPPDI